MAAASPTLVVTKLLPPPPRPDRVARPRLTDRLAGSTSRLTLISAPPGFGKTALLADWLARATADGLSVGWVSLDSADDDPARFWTYLIAACRDLGGESVGQSALAIIRTPQPPPSETALALLVNDLAALPADRPRALVLDDYHAIGSPAIHQGVAFLIDHLPPGVRLVMATRADPPMPLARLRVRGQLTEIRAADLRFTDDEAAEFVGRVAGGRLGSDVAATLAARTEGWAAGLQLAALALQSQDPESFLRDFTGSHRFVFDYLADEVLGRLPKSDRSFLLQTSILESLSGPLCDAVTGRADGQATLRRLEAANLFVVPLDAAREWYRYHHLFASFLRAQLEAESEPAEVVALHRRAGEWHESEGTTADAVEHAFQGGDESRAADLIAARIQPLFRRNELTTIVAWCRRLSPGSIEARPGLGLSYAWALLAIGRSDEVEERLAAVERTCGIAKLSIADRGFAVLPAGARALAIQVAVIRCTLALNRWDIPLLMQHTDALLPHLADDAADLAPDILSSLKPVVYFDRGLAHEFGGRLDVAAEAFGEAVRASGGDNNPHVTALALSHLAAVRFARGQIDAAVATYAEAREAARSIDGARSPLSAIAEAGLGIILLERGELNAAQALFDEAIELGKRWNNAESLTMSHFGLARVHRARGDCGAAAASLRALAASIPAVSRDAHLPTIRAFEARLALDGGDLGAARRWSDTLTPPAEPVALLPRAGDYATLARVRIAEGRSAEAEPLLATLVEVAESTGRARLAVEALALLALARQARGQSGAALDALDRALALATSGGFRRVFLDEGPALVDLLREAARRGRFRGFVADLLAAADLSASATIGSTAACPPPPPDNRSGQSAAPPISSSAPGARSRPAAPSPLVEALTQREREVLALVVAGRSNAEIAESLVLSVGTVKTHTHNLYTKLGVGTRAAAIARARALGLA